MSDKPSPGDQKARAVGGPQTQAGGPGWVEFLGLAVISFVLSGVMSAFMTAFNIGFGPHYLVAVATGWAVGFVVSYPTAIVIVPLVVRWQMHQNQRRSRGG